MHQIVKRYLKAQFAANRMITMLGRLGFKLDLVSYWMTGSGRDRNLDFLAIKTKACPKSLFTSSCLSES